MRQHLKHRKESFRFAWQGLRFTWRYHPNFIIHTILATVAILAGFSLGLSKIELAIILVLITLGLATELANTAIEAVTDLIVQKHHIQAKIAKDVAAAMMLIVAIGSVIIASIIYIPYLKRLLIPNV